jgi:hypothetical protein
MRPGQCRFGGRLPTPRGEQILLAGVRTLNVLPHAFAQHLGRSSAVGAARIHKGPAKLTLHAQPQTCILGFYRHAGSLDSGYTWCIQIP